MQAEVKGREAVVILELNEQEVAFLKGLVLNPMCESAEEEDIGHRHLRLLFWNTLDDLET